ncbi:ATPase associated with various cellular activities AAA_3 protein [Purpureocillium lilacinum]|uniref:Uncharacterized protein n=2 Tax=Purpureocillium lilacinum TaxID=33203 RepID=A0ACC4DMK7_PURLI|nr:ATPase associated with various cellular activities AAA_3 protein [Purpureocillium lilacinum]OAQ85784.1 ATPase associated with various cellular activities AAA_3 protein [Purpureocillium lilacinum]
MADDLLLEKVHDLSDLELAILLCLVSREHGIISTPSDTIDDLIEELQLVARKTFGLSCVVINCHAGTTLEEFASALLYLPKPTAAAATTPARTPSFQARSDSASYFVANPQQQSRPSRGSISPLTVLTGGGGGVGGFGPAAQIANCVLARNLDCAPRAVQIQALELLRTRRIFTRTSVQAAPKQFVFVPVLEADSGGEAHVTPHLNDFFSLAHWHDPEDGLVNMEEAADDAASVESVVRSKHQDELPAGPSISESEISHLAQLSQQVQADIDVIRYQMNVVSFLRMHRAVDHGITPAATKHFDKLMRCVAPLHKLDYVTPALVGLAARKVYLHRIRITSPAKERSMQWGSKLEAVQSILDGVGPEEVIEEVLEMVTAPL